MVNKSKSLKIKKLQKIKNGSYPKRAERFHMLMVNTVEGMQEYLLLENIKNRPSHHHFLMSFICHSSTTWSSMTVTYSRWRSNGHVTPYSKSNMADGVGVRR